MRATTKLKLVYLGVAALDTWLAGASAGSRAAGATRAGRLARAGRLVTKPALMPLLAGSFAASPNARRSPLRTTTLAGQAFGWGGDVALLGHGTRSFAIGTGCFGVGHAAYISGFLRHRSSRPFLRSLPTRMSIRLWVGAGPVMALAAARQERLLGPAVAAYTGLLAGTFATAGHLDPALPASARRLSAAGAGLFLVSDTVLGLRQFVLPAVAPGLLREASRARLDAALERTVMGTYAAAQLLLAEGAARQGRVRGREDGRAGQAQWPTRRVPCSGGRGSRTTTVSPN